MSKIIGVIVAFLVFLGWISLVGNPHVVETIIGLILSGLAGFWTYSKISKMSSNK